MNKDMMKMLAEAVRRAKQVQHPEDITIEYQLGPRIVPDWAYEPDPDTGEFETNPEQWANYPEGKFSGFETKDDVPVGLRPVVQGNKLILPNNSEESRQYTNTEPSGTLFGDINSSGGIIVSDYVTIEKTDEGYVIYPNSPHPLNNMIGKTIFKVNPKNKSRFRATRPLRKKGGGILPKGSPVTINHFNYLRSQLKKAIQHIYIGAERTDGFLKGRKASLHQNFMEYKTNYDGYYAEHRLTIKSLQSGYKADHGDVFLIFEAAATVDPEDLENRAAKINMTAEEKAKQDKIIDKFMNDEEDDIDDESDEDTYDKQMRFDDYDLEFNYFSLQACCHHAYLDVIIDFFDLDIDPELRKKYDMRKKRPAPQIVSPGQTYDAASVPTKYKPATQDKTLLDAEAFLQSRRKK